MMDFYLSEFMFASTLAVKWALRLELNLIWLS